MRFAALAALVVGFASFAAAQSGADWSYEGRTGPLNWGRLDPAYAACSRGHEQSPVDLRGARLNKNLAPIQFHYIATAVTIENDGRTIIVRPNRGSYIVAGGVRYDLDRIEFRHPSEHTVKGKFSDVEIQLVHRSAGGKLAILAVLLNAELDMPNAILSTLWEHLPTKAGAAEKIADMVNPGGLLPGGRGYWTYTGSLNTPPCTEGAQWFVFEEEMTISRSQLRVFSSIFRLNTRPVQDLHGRRIEADE